LKTDAEKSALSSQEMTFYKYIIKIEFLNCNDISQSYCFNCMFDQINAVLVSKETSFNNNI